MDFIFCQDLLQDAYLQEFQKKLLHESILKLDAMRPLSEESAELQYLILSQSKPDVVTNLKLTLLLALQERPEWFLLEEKDETMLVQESQYAVSNLLERSWINNYIQHRDHFNDPDYQKHPNKKIYEESIQVFDIPSNTSEKIRQEMFCKMMWDSIKIEEVEKTMSTNIDPQLKKVIIKRTISQIVDRNKYETLTIETNYEEIQKDVILNVEKELKKVETLRQKDIKIAQAFNSLKKIEYKDHLNTLLETVFNHSIQRGKEELLQKEDYYRIFYLVFQCNITLYDLASLGYPTLSEKQKSIMIMMALSYLTNYQANLMDQNLEVKISIQKLIKRIKLNDEEKKIFSNVIGQPQTFANTGNKLTLKKTQNKKKGDPKNDGENPQNCFVPNGNNPPPTNGLVVIENSLQHPIPSVPQNGNNGQITEGHPERVAVSHSGYYTNNQNMTAGNLQSPAQMMGNLAVNTQHPPAVPPQQGFVVNSAPVVNQQFPPIQENQNIDEQYGRNPSKKGKYAPNKRFGRGRGRGRRGGTRGTGYIPNSSNQDYVPQSQDYVSQNPSYGPNNQSCPPNQTFGTNNQSCAAPPPPPQNNFPQTQRFIPQTCFVPNQGFAPQNSTYSNPTTSFVPNQNLPQNPGFIPVQQNTGFNPNQGMMAQNTVPQNPIYVAPAPYTQQQPVNNPSGYY